jgi:hypothetical protein
MGRLRPKRREWPRTYDQRAFFALGRSRRDGRFALSVPGFLLPREGQIRAWLYDPGAGRLLRLAGVVEARSAP